jgi:hypothetical protein
MRRTARLILVAPGVLAAFALVSATSPAAVEPAAVAQASGCRTRIVRTCEYRRHRRTRR